MYPFAIVAGALALYFGVVALQRPRGAAILAVLLWTAYSVYEYYVANGTLCDANCNIRVDLVLFFPLLGIVTYFALQKEPRAGAVAFLYLITSGIAALLAAALGYTSVAVIAGVAALLAAVYAIRSIASISRTR